LIDYFLQFGNPERPLLAESSRSDLSNFLNPNVRSWEKQTFRGIRLNNFRIAQN
jgi:hypothetical protein